MFGDVLTVMEGMVGICVVCVYIQMWYNMKMWSDVVVKGVVWCGVVWCGMMV